jgi:hypothetical protein
MVGGEGMALTTAHDDVDYSIETLDAMVQVLTRGSASKLEGSGHCDLESAVAQPLELDARILVRRGYGNRATAPSIERDVDLIRVEEMKDARFRSAVGRWQPRLLPIRAS